MPGNGTDPVLDDEVVYRRVSEKSGWYNKNSERPVAWEAFKPNRQDTTGLSVWRARYKGPQEVAAINARPSRRYYVLALRVAALRSAGVIVQPTPAEGGPGHASLSNMTTEAYQANKDEIGMLARIIADTLIDQVHGPYGPFD